MMRWNEFEWREIEINTTYVYPLMAHLEKGNVKLKKKHEKHRYLRR